MGAGGGGDPAVSTSHQGPQLRSVSRVSKILVWGADAPFSCLLTSRSSEHFENSLFFKAGERSFYDLFTPCIERAIGPDGAALEVERD